MVLLSSPHLGGTGWPLPSFGGAAFLPHLLGGAALVGAAVPSSVGVMLYFSSWVVLSSPPFLLIRVCRNGD